MKRNNIFILFIFILTIALCEAPAMAQGKLDQIRERGYLIGATFNFDNRPFSFRDDSGKMTGMDVELLQAVANKIGVKLQIIELPWDSGISKSWDPDYQWGLFDIAAATITIKPERAKISGFSNPYYLTGQAIVTKKGSSIKTQEDIKGKSVSVMSGTTGDEYAKKDSKPIPFGSYDEVIEAVKMSIVTAAIMDGAPAISYAKDDPTLSVLDELLTDERYGLALPKGDDEFLKLVNEVIEVNKEPLKSKWF